MLKNYFKLAVRNLLKHRGYSLINVVGLALGITCFVVILLFIQDEISYDHYHEHADRIYRVAEILEPAENSSSQPFSVAPTLLNDFPGMVEQAVRFFNMQAPSLTLEYGPEKRFNEPRLFFADSTVFKVFTFPFLRGNPETALHEPNATVVTESMARKYFGNEEPMGKILRFEGEHDLHVTGILQDVPANFHFKFDFLVSFSTLRNILGAEPQGWYWNPNWTYILLTEGTTPEMLEAQFPAFVDQYFPEIIKDKATLYLQPLTDIHLHSHLDFEIEPNSDIAYVYIFSVIAAFVLLIACINFMNLATARSAKRAREVGMRKVLGAYRGQLIRQFLGESLVMALVAVLVAVPLIVFSLPVLNAFLNKSIAFDLGGNPALLLGLLGAALFVGLVAGVYPAFVLSAFEPLQVLKGKLNLGRFNVDAILRKGLVTFQFAISVMLIIGTTIAYSQLRYVQDAHLGFDEEQIVMAPILRTNLMPQYDSFKQQLLQHNNIRHVTIAEDVLGSKYQTHSFMPEGATQPEQFHRLMVRPDFIHTFGLELVAGRTFSEEFATDDSMAVIINETMVRRLNWGRPEAAVGREFVAAPDNRHFVVGVVKDFNYASLHNPISPFVLDIPDTPGAQSFFGRYLAIRIVPKDFSGTLGYVQQKWSEFLPNRPFEYFFMDEKLDKLYRAEENLGQVAGTFSLFAIFVACMGLFGLASFTAEQRTKEIGVRKVLGASVLQIFLNLSREFLKLVTAGILVAWPVSYLLASSWLQSFAYRTDIGILPFVAAALVALLTAWSTVSYQALKAAVANPVRALRYE